MQVALKNLPGAALLKSSGLLLISMTIVNAGNYLFNLLLGRWLGPVAFADLSLIVTLFLVITCITSALQTITTKYAAQYAAVHDTKQLQALRQRLGTIAWQSGIVIGALFACAAPLWANFFQMHNPWLFVLFALGIPFYFAQGVDRGMLQGQTRFAALAISYQIEMWVRLLIGCSLVLFGLSAGGGVAALTLSILAMWLYARSQMQHTKPPTTARLRAEQIHEMRQYAIPVVIGLLGQIIISNADILAVRRFFPADTAGHYAALALLGRIIFFATWSIVTALFPIVAQRHERGEPHRQLLLGGLAIVGSVSSILIGAAYLIPNLIVELLFTSAYLPIAPYLGPYALSVGFYACANVFINYRLSLSQGFGSWLALIAGIVQIAALALVHASLHEIIAIQLLVMGALCITLIIWECIAHKKS
jgi:O-antigen/teichoic acid export membrane protein